jgi:hypothetical protein
VPIEAIADPRLVALVHARFRPEIVREHALPAFAGELPHHLEPADWRAGFLSVEEGGAPLDVREAMREATPQAHLRDLFRPVYSDEPVALDRTPISLDPGGREAMAELRAALVREPLPRLGGLVEELQATRAAWRAFLDQPWQPYLRDDEPRREVMVAIEPGLAG